MPGGAISEFIYGWNFTTLLHALFFAYLIWFFMFKEDAKPRK